MPAAWCRRAVRQVLCDEAGARPAHRHDELEQNVEHRIVRASALGGRRHTEAALPYFSHLVDHRVEEVLVVKKDLLRGHSEGARDAVNDDFVHAGILRPWFGFVEREGLLVWPSVPDSLARRVVDGVNRNALVDCELLLLWVAVLRHSSWRAAVLAFRRASRAHPQGRRWRAEGGAQRQSILGERQQRVQPTSPADGDVLVGHRRRPSPDLVEGVQVGRQRRVHLQDVVHAHAVHAVRQQPSVGIVAQLPEQRFFVQRGLDSRPSRA